jgi:hypothetical protein
MQAVITWCTAHWELISLGLLFIACVLNGITKQFGAGHPRIVPIFGVILEAVSFITSKGCRTSLPGPLGRLKLPLQNVPPKLEQVTAPRRISGLTLLLFIGGCAGTTLADAHIIIAGMSKATLSGLHVQCLAATVQCKKDGKTAATCTTWQECDQIRTEFLAGVEKMEQGILFADKAMKRAKEKGWIK